MEQEVMKPTAFDDAEYAVLHAQAKSIKRGSVTVNEDEERVYTLSKQDTRLLTQLGVSVVQVGGMNLEFIDGTLVERKELPKRKTKAAKTKGKKAPVAPKATKKKKKKKKAAPEEPIDLLMWVGSRHYATIGHFVREARMVGCSKRIGRVLHCVEPGKTRIFLAHDEGLVGEGLIFGYFIVGAIEMVVEKPEDIPEALRDRCTPLALAEARREVERGCGWRDIAGAIYFTSYTDKATLKQIAKELGCQVFDIKGGFIELNPPYDYGAMIEPKCKHFRGARMINGDKLLNATSPVYRKPTSLLHPSPDKEPAWTKKHDKLLLKMVNERTSSKARAFKEFEFATGHSKASATYRHQKLTEGKTDDDS